MKRGVRNAILWVLALGFCAILASRYTDRQLTEDLGGYTKEQFDIVYNALSRVYYPELTFADGEFRYAKSDELLLVEDDPQFSADAVVTATVSADGKELEITFSSEGQLNVSPEEWQLDRKLEGSWYSLSRREAENLIEWEEGRVLLSVFYSHPVEDFEKNITYWDCPMEPGEYRIKNTAAILDGKTVTIGTEFTVTK